MTVLRMLAKGSPEALAVQAGEIDAVIDYSKSNVFLLPAARRALQAARPVEARIANHLLAALPGEDYRRLRFVLEEVALKAGEVLHEPGLPVEHVYFPIDCVAVLLTTLEGDRALGACLVGYEGMIGIAVALGAENSFTRTVVQTGGVALRMKAARFSEALVKHPALRKGLDRYANAKLDEARRSVACNCYHSIEGRLARWLLMVGDRARAETLYATQLFLAQLLGVRRTTLNIAAGALQQSGLIDYSRGNVRIVNRPGLAAAACSCYRATAR
jgi:CRP-like cAMP-binding protein